MIYDDDILQMWKRNSTLAKPREKFCRRYNMLHMGTVKWFLGINIRDLPAGVYMRQNSHVNKMFERFNMIDAKNKSVSLSIGNDVKRKEFPPNYIRRFNIHILN